MNEQDTKIMEYFVTACKFLDGRGLIVSDDDLLRKTMKNDFGQFQTIKGLCQTQTLLQRDNLLKASKGLLKAFDIPLITKHIDFGGVRLNAIQATEKAIANVEAK